MWKMLKYSTPSFTSFWQGLPLGLPVPYPSSRVCRGEVLPTVEDNWAGGHTSLWNQVGYIPGCWAAGPHHCEATVLSLKDGSGQGRSLITGNRQISHPYSRRRINRRREVLYQKPIPILCNIYMAISVAFSCTLRFVGIPYTGFPTRE